MKYVEQNLYTIRQGRNNLATTDRFFGQLKPAACKWGFNKKLNDNFKNHSLNPANNETMFYRN